MTIREATFKDVPRLVDMGGAFIRSSAYKSMADNRQARSDMMRRLIESSDGAIFVQERYGRIVGMIGVCAYMHPWAGELVGGEVFWWVEPEARGSGIKLLKCAERWMAAKGCITSQMIAPNDRVANTYRRLGYAKLEECWHRSL